MPSTAASSSVTLSPALRRLILQTFTKKYSLQLHASSLSFIGQTLAEHHLLDVIPGTEDEDAQRDAVEMLARGCLDLGVMEEAGRGSSIITAKQLAHVYSQLVAEGSSSSSNGMNGAATGDAHSSYHMLPDEEAPPPQRYFDIIDSFDLPRVEWDSVAKTFVKLPNKPSVLPPPLAKPLAIRQRLQALRALVLRNENFCPPLPGITRSRGGSQNTWMKLTSTSNLLGRPNGRFLLFGLLTTTSDGILCLEDEDGRVELDMTSAIPGEGIFTLGSLILVEGRYADEGEGEKLYVNAIGHPPSEVRSRAREMYGHIDWSGKGVVSAKEEAALSSSLQAHHPDLSFIVLSDLHLDIPSTLHSLRAVLQGYIDANFVPFLIVLCGNFLSEEGRRKADGGLSNYTDAFTALSDVISSFPTLLQSSNFLFIPGPTDPYSSSTLPRQPLPSLLTEPFLQRLSSKLNISLERTKSKVIFGSNPCRVRFWGKDVVIFRDEMLERMRRNSISVGEEREPKEGGMKKFLVSTLLDQSHLSPLIQQARPVLWEYDHTLRLYPMPSALILADSSEHFELTYEGCHVLNPGSFLSTTTSTSGGGGGGDGVGGLGVGAGAGWLSYYPSGRGERSELPRA